MPKPPSWEDADLLLRIDDLAARPETRRALDWFRKTHLGVKEPTPTLISRESVQFEFMQRFIELFETIGVFVKFEVLNEEMVHERWISDAPWQFFKATIEEVRKTMGPEYAANFEWIASRDRAWTEKRSRENPRRTSD
jgi:hypothetical protein